MKKRSNSLYWTAGSEWKAGPVVRVPAWIQFPALLHTFPVTLGKTLRKEDVCYHVLTNMC